MVASTATVDTTAVSVVVRGHITAISREVQDVVVGRLIQQNQQLLRRFVFLGIQHEWVIARLG